MFIDFDFKDIFMNASGICKFKVHTKTGMDFMRDAFGKEFERHKEYEIGIEEARLYKQTISDTKQFIMILS